MLLKESLLLTKAAYLIKSKTEILLQFKINIFDVNNCKVLFFSCDQSWIVSIVISAQNPLLIEVKCEISLGVCPGVWPGMCGALCSRSTQTQQL